MTVNSGYSELRLQLSAGTVNCGCSQQQLQLAAALVGGGSVCRVDWQQLQLAGAPVRLLCTIAGGFRCLN